jgi:3-dehydroquinate synthase
MCAAARLGVDMGVTPAEVPGQIKALCEAFGLPTAISCASADYAAAIGLDKKGSGDQISLILLERLGSALVHRLPKEDLLTAIRALGKEG